ncbi:divalent metal cation transporter [Calidifontibacter sp. DB0510]|uniref:Divalent metal cation transporter n=1 Tax=Metallococcus carri TaxID=1656884 RepID=A0A967B6X3_9MICO|nr:divalent metal cation transporter [Metallococcus carri]NOP38486.1 divalent metal cation transporter [Calidifontibacter sp. DB2511S]
MTRVSFSPPADRRSALDRAHRGDVVGALGRVSSLDTEPRRSWRRRLATLAAVMGPGVVVLVADNDAGGVATYAQIGQNDGLRFLWLLVVLAAALWVNQEMVGRLGAVTGAGHARLIYERFGRRWGAFALGDLLVVNFLIVVTEFIGVAFGLGYFGVSKYISVPLAALVLIGLPATGSFRRWERAVCVFVALSLVAVPLVVIALVGTTVAPWQLFFHQSNVIDKRITARWLAYERADTTIGTVLFALGAVAVLVACALAFDGTALHGAFVNAGTVADDLRRQAGPWAGALFAVVLLNGSVLGAGAVTLSASYAIGDVTGTKHSLHRSWRDAPRFYGSYTVLVILAAAIVLIPGAPLGVVTTGVQALAGVLLPSALVFLVLLCNDREVLGPWTNPRWLNVIAGAVVAAFLVLSGLLVIATLFPDLALGWSVIAISEAAAAALGALAGLRLGDGGTGPSPRSPTSDSWWTMPPIESLRPPAASRSRTLSLILLRGYLVLAVIAVVVKVVRLMMGA